MDDFKENEQVEESGESEQSTIFSAPEEHKDKDLKFLFDVISFCRFVQVETKEENEILQYHFSKAINAIKTIIEKGEK